VTPSKVNGVLTMACRTTRAATPRPSGRCGPSVGRAILTAVVLASCASPFASPVPAPDLPTLDVNPLKFATIVLRPDVEVKTTVLGAAIPATARTHWYVLEYQEQENRKGFVPEREAEYVNLFLVSQVERIGADHDIVRNRYLVVDLWGYSPTRGIKTCHQWTIWEDDPKERPTRATFRFLIEDFNNVFLGERNAPVDARAVAQLGDFYVKTKRLLLERVRGHPGDIAHHL
jgi:hypothetical protein